jgi:EAL domain-containing protein (putative c-di-GMP-specific phosphodiesterase class I)
VLDRVDAAGIDPRTFVVEVTESGVMGGLDAAVSSLEAIRAAGCRVAVDDFGTGYSSIAYLRQLPVDTVKIDRSLLPDETGTGGDWALMGAIVDLVRAVDKESIIEGVETAEQATRVAALGATMAQGFHFARPLRADDLPAWLRSGQASAFR